MKYTIFVLLLLLSSIAFSAGDISITIDSLANTSGNSAIEVCGTAIEKDGLKPLLVTVKHYGSYYTTLTAPNNKWCVLIMRWTFNGTVEASATTLLNPKEESFKVIKKY